MASASGVVQLVDSAKNARKRTRAIPCIICKKSSGAVHGTDEGRAKLKTAAEKLKDRDLLDNLDGDSLYHSRTCHATYIKKAARAPSSDDSLSEEPATEENDGDVQYQNSLWREEGTSSNANLSTERTKRPRNEPNPQSIPKEERPCIICNSKRLRVKRDEVFPNFRLMKLLINTR